MNAVTAGRLILLLACACSLHCRRSLDCPDCSVILITVDTLRRDHLPAYGYARETTPAIDRFFAPGTIFDKATSSAPCTLPAVEQLLTGRIDRAEQAPRLAEILQPRGFVTAAVVSQHFFRDQAAPRPEFARGFKHFDVQGAGEVDHHAMTRRTAEQVIDRAVAFLRAHRRQAQVFLWVHLFDPHDPYEPPAQHRLFGGRGSEGDRRARLLAGAGPGEPWTRAGRIFDAAAVDRYHDLYDGEIRFVDAELGRLFAVIEETRRLRRSLVILTSDHGEWLGEEARWDHCQTLNAREIDVPLLVRLRGRALGRRARQGAVSTLDIVPTVLARLGIDAPPGLDGTDLAVSGERRLVHTRWNGHTSIQDRRWKLVATPPDARRLVRLDRDPWEQSDLSSQEPEQLARLLQALADRPDTSSALDAELVEQLRAIGYVPE